MLLVHMQRAAGDTSIIFVRLSREQIGRAELFDGELDDFRRLPETDDIVNTGLINDNNNNKHT